MATSTHFETPKGRRKPPLLSWIKGIGQVLFTVLITMIGLLFVTFIIGRVMPIDPVLSIVGESATNDVYEAAYRELGLDKPLFIQFLIFLGDVFQGDFDSRPGDVARLHSGLSV